MTNSQKLFRYASSGSNEVSELETRDYFEEIKKGFATRLENKITINN